MEKWKACLQVPPPLEALRSLVSEAATRDEDDSDEKIIMINDISRASFEAKATRSLCVELPEEDRTAEDRRFDRVGLLVMSLYGTRDAANNWQEEVARAMGRWGFTRTRYNPCLYMHPRLQIRTLVHGDDFVSTGKRGAIQKFEEQLKSRFEVKTTKVGAGKNEVKEARILNRILRITEKGRELEADQRHSEMIVEEMGLSGARGVSTPGEDPKKHEEEENGEELDPEKARRYKSTAARANYLAQDRPDTMYSTRSRSCAGTWRGRQLEHGEHSNGWHVI